MNGARYGGRDEEAGYSLEYPAKNGRAPAVRSRSRVLVINNEEV
jgi:hypothetical protein